MKYLLYCCWPSWCWWSSNLSDRGIMSKICQYFFAPHSPWSYLGHERFVAIARQHGVQIEVRPFDLNKVFGVSGGLPLAKRAPQRQAYRLTELARWSTFLNVPMNVQPKFFPVSPELAAKLIVATRLALGVDVSLELSSAIMRGLWAEEKNIGDEETLVQIANSCGLDGRMLFKSAERPACRPSTTAIRRMPPPPASSARRGMCMTAKATGARTVSISSNGRWRSNTRSYNHAVD